MKQSNSNTAYGTILNDVYLGRAFIEAADLIKSKAGKPRDITMQLLQMFECYQYTNPDFVIELYELLTVTKSRNYMIAGIKGK